METVLCFDAILDLSQAGALVGALQTSVTTSCVHFKRIWMIHLVFSCVLSEFLTQSRCHLKPHSNFLPVPGQMLLGDAGRGPVPPQHQQDVVAEEREVAACGRSAAMPCFLRGGSQCQLFAQGWTIVQECNGLLVQRHLSASRSTF